MVVGGDEVDWVVVYFVFGIQCFEVVVEFSLVCLFKGRVRSVENVDVVDLEWIFFVSFVGGVGSCICIC